MADKKLLEESVIERFQQLANIPKTSKGMLSEGINAGRTEFVTREGGFAGSRSAMVSEEEEMDVPGDDAGESLDSMTGPDAEGGDDAMAAVEELINLINDKFLPKMGLEGSQVELDSGSGEDGEEDMGAPEDQEAMDSEVPPVMESDDADSDGNKYGEMKEVSDLDEELDESIELVDDTLIEKLLQRVSARLVAEARKNRELAEGKKGWGPSGMTKGKPPKHKGSPKGKVGTPFSKSVSVKGLAGRGK